MKTRSRLAAFTMVELLVATCISSVLGLMIYGVASEGVISFARNVSINRSYSNARTAIDRISNQLQSAAHVPILIDATGADIFPVPAVYVAVPGVRFWRYDSTPAFCITTPAALTDTSLTVDLTKPAANATAPAIGDIITIAVLGFQAQATNVVTTGNAATVSFSGTIASNTNPTLTAAALSDARTRAADTSITPLGKMTCLDWTSVAFIAVNNQLRYYPKFISGSTAINTASNYKVLTYLAANVNGAAPPGPFSLGPTPSLNVDLYAEAPDYNTRTSTGGTNNVFNGINSANTYTFVQTALAPRNPTLGLLRTPY